MKNNVLNFFLIEVNKVNITNNERIADDLRYAIARDEDFRANPKNIYHYGYQRMVNRIFFVFLVFMTVLALVVQLGLTKGILAFLLGVAIGAAIGFIGYCLVLLSVNFVTEFFYWIRGY
jgi:hypothetical protein